MGTMPDSKRNHKHYITLFQKDRDLPLQSMMKANNWNCIIKNGNRPHCMRNFVMWRLIIKHAKQFIIYGPKW